MIQFNFYQHKHHLIADSNILSNKYLNHSTIVDKNLLHVIMTAEETSSSVQSFGKF